MFIPMPLLTCLLLWAALDVSESLKYSHQAESESLARGEKILEEIKKLGKHDWAGEYIRGNGLGCSRIMLSPSAGYLYEEHGCLGVYDRNYGSVTFMRDRIKLAFTFDPTTRRTQSPASEYLIMRWGERRYLVPNDRAVDFCNAFNLYGHHIRGFFFVRCDNANQQVSGKPEVPVQYRSYLLDKPVDASIIAVGKSATRPYFVEGMITRETHMTIDAGSKQGLREGMELAVTIPELTFEKVRITRVMENLSEGIFSQSDNMPPLPGKDWKLSTRSPFLKLLEEIKLQEK